MGTINYGSSDYITIGYNLSPVDYEDEYYYDWIADDFDQVKYTLEKYSFYYFDIQLKSGYYEGFYIDIEYNYKYCLDSYIDRSEAQKEITQIKKFLLECIDDFGCCSVWPGWCTTYQDRKNTKKELAAAIREMRATVKNTPVWSRMKEEQA